MSKNKKNTKNNLSQLDQEQQTVKSKKPYVKKQDRAESKVKLARKQVKRVGKKFTERKFLTKLIIVVSSVALLGTSVLPYLIR
jgi:hypothetical protein